MNQGKQSTGTVTAADVRAVRFPLVRRGGYDPKQVDPFLEVVAQTLEGGPLADPTMNAEYIHGVRFGTVRRSGYEPTKVDAFLDRVIDTLEPLDGKAPAASGFPRPQPVLPSEPEPAATATATADDEPPPEPEVVAAAAVATADRLDPHQSAVEQGQAHLDRLRELYDAGLLSDKEVKVLSQRVKRWARELMEMSENGQVDANTVA